VCAQCNPTDITITFNSESGKGSGLVTWRTTPEHDLLGFNIIVIDQKGNRIQQNTVLIPCEECITDLGHFYTFVIPKHKSGHNVFVETVRLDGRTDVFGPALRQ